VKTKHKEVKMAKPKTYVTIILDQSGSMCDTKAQAVQGYNEQVQQMKLNSKDQDIFCSLITFNGEVFEHLWCEPADKLTEATAGDYNTEGSTAMRDAVGYAIEKLQRTTDAKEDVAYLVVIISDGEENTSRHYSVEAIRELKDSVDKTGKWTFTYMGCDDKYLNKVAAEMNIPISNVAKWSNSTHRAAAHGQHMNAVKMKSYYGARAKGVTAQNCVYSEDACKLADFTEDVPAEDAADVLKHMVAPNHLWVPPVNPVDLNVNMNILNDGHTSMCNTSPFKNYSPVSWKA
jgi:uncharacterized protein YegL